jgi:hypothetical protein
MSRKLIALVSLFLLQTVFASTVNRNWGAITVKNNGGYHAKFTIDYYQGGVQKSIDSGSYQVGQARSLSIPPDATYVLVRGFADVFVNNWSVIFNDAIGIPLIKCYEVSGTTLGTKWKVVDGCVY